MKTRTKYIVLFSGIAITCAIAYLLKDTKRPPRDFKEIEKAKVVRVVTDYNNVGYYVSSDTIAGFNYGLLKLMELYSGLKFEVKVENSLENSLKGLEDGQYDIVARNIPVNSEMKDDVSFTKSIVRNKYILVQRKAEFNDSIQPVRNHLHLAGKTVHIPKGSPAILRLRNLSHEIGDTIYVQENDVYEAVQLAMMVSKGEIDYAVCDNKAAEKILKVLPEVDIKTDIGFTHFEAWAVRKNSPVLLDSINAWLDRIVETREYKQLYNKYYK